MSLGISQFSSISKNFDTMVEQMNELKGYTLEKIEQLEDSTNIKKKKHLKTTYMSKTQARMTEGRGWYDKHKYIQLTVPREFYDGLEDKSSIKHFYSDKWGSDVYLKIIIKEDNQEKLTEFKEVLDLIEQVDQKTHEENLKIAADNKKLEDTIFNILKESGISTSYYGYKTSRSRNKTEMYYNFPSEIRKQIQTSYREDGVKKDKERLLDQINSYWKKEIDKVKQERLQQEKQQKEKEENRKLALLLAKYDLDLDCEWEDIMDKIIEKDKYLKLAHYLEKNRGDWNDGCSYAESGLNDFNIETELDQKIYDDINEIIENWGDYMDGRAFRDCEYNYSVLYGMVEDEDLMKDYSTVNEKISEW
jgi:hypothetical protein